MIYYELSLDKNNNKIWNKYKFCRALNHRRIFSKQLQIILFRILQKSRRIKTLECIYCEYKIIKILDEVIEFDYFGSSQNRRRFYDLVNKITTQSRFECVYKSTLSKGYDVTVIPWLQGENLDELKCRRVLYRTNLFLLQYVVKPLIKHFYHPLRNYKSYQITFVKRSKWHSFEHKILNELLHGKFLELVDKGCQSRGKLKLFPKSSCESGVYRPLIYPITYNSMIKARLKHLSKSINNLALTFSKIGKNSLYDSWRRYCIKIEGETVYCIKVDVKDAFGNINIDILCHIIVQSKFNKRDKQFLINHIQNQYVIFHKKQYRWKHGLLQGDHLSPSLCNLYMAYFEKKCFQDFCKPGCFLHRMTDDYLFCSLEKEDIDKFEFKVKSVFQLNDDKTQKTDDVNNVLCYYGQVFNLHTRQVSKYYDFKKRYSIRYKFKFWNIKSPISENSKESVLLKALRFPSNNNCFKKLELNTVFNTEATVLKNYFDGMVFIAFKFQSAVAAVKEFKQKASELPFLSDIIKHTVNQYSRKVLNKIGKCAGKHLTGCITFNLLRSIAYRAFILVLKKENEFYKDIICWIKEHNNSLYLKLDEVDMEFHVFDMLPKSFQNICISRNTPI